MFAVSRVPSYACNRRFGIKLANPHMLTRRTPTCKAKPNSPQDPESTAEAITKLTYGTEAEELRSSLGRSSMAFKDDAREDVEPKLVQSKDGGGLAAGRSSSGRMLLLVLLWAAARPVRKALRQMGPVGRLKLCHFMILAALAPKLSVAVLPPMIMASTVAGLIRDLEVARSKREQGIRPRDGVLGQGSEASQYCGPYPLDSSGSDPQQVTGEGWSATVTVTSPISQISNPQAVFHVIVLFNGFKCKSEWYHGLVRLLASFGFRVVQYDIASLRGDITEECVLDGILDWLGKSLPGIDVGRIGVMGHSRGGKTAVQRLAEDDRVVAAVLLDPVDNSYETILLNALVTSVGLPDALRSLSAAQVLKDKAPQKPIGIIGAGVCNLFFGAPLIPSEENHKKFWEAAPPGSELLVLMKAGHMQFLDLRPGTTALTAIAANAILGHGDSKNTVQVSALFAAAVFHDAFNTQQDNVARGKLDDLGYKTDRR